MAMEGYHLWQVILIYATRCYHTGIWKQYALVQSHAFCCLLFCEAWNSLRLGMYPPPLRAESILLLLKGILATCIKYYPSCRSSQQRNGWSHRSRQSRCGNRLCCGRFSSPALLFMVCWVSWEQLVSLPCGAWKQQQIWERKVLGVTCCPLSLKNSNSLL